MNVVKYAVENGVDYYLVGNETDGLHAAHVMANGNTIGVFAEPLDRTQKNWDDEKESEMRKAIFAEIATWLDHDILTIQFDPGRDQAESQDVKTGPAWADDIITQLKNANGTRKYRTLSQASVLELINDVADKNDFRPTVLHGGRTSMSYASGPHTTLAMAFRAGDYVYLGIAQESAHKPSPERIWDDLEPWDVGTFETRRAKLERWAKYQDGVIKIHVSEITKL